MATVPDHPLINSTPEDRRVRANRADLGFETVMADRLYSPQRKVFGWRNWWMTRTYEHLWPLANTWSAFCTLASLPDHAGVADVLSLLLDGLPAYHRDGPDVLTGSGPVGFESTVVPPIGPGGDVYYDDNAWLGLALVRHQELMRDDVSLPLAERIFRYVVTGWSNDEKWAVPGGIRWKADRSNTSRNTCANGPVAALGCRLHRETGDRATLDWAVRIYRWTRAALLRDDHLYADRISPQGTVVLDLWTYNQGSMIGAGVLLADATGDPAYLAEARETAKAAAAHYGLRELIGNGPAFNAVYFRNLFLLPPDSVQDARAVTRPAPQHWALAGTYDDFMWDVRDRRNGLFPGGGTPLNRTGPMVQIDALLAGAQPHP